MDTQYLIATVSPLAVPVLVALGATVAVARHRRRGRGGQALETWVRWWFYGAVAGGAIIVGVAFLAVPDQMASSIGFDTANDFQREVAFANLGFALGAIAAVRLGAGARVALALGYALFLWGATAGHIWEYAVHGDGAPGNVGGILVYDIVIPVVALALAVRSGRRGAAVGVESFDRTKSTVMRMATRKVTLSIDEAALAMAETAAARDGVSTSSWLSAAARREAVRAGAGTEWGEPVRDAADDDADLAAAEADVRAAR